MKKFIKPFLIGGTLIAAIAVGYIQNGQHKNDIALTDLMQASDADAECNQYNGWQYGRCLPMALGGAGLCVFDTSATQCTP